MFGPIFVASNNRSAHANVTTTIDERLWSVFRFFLFISEAIWHRRPTNVRNSYARNKKDQHLCDVWTCETYFRRDKIEVNAIIIIFFCFPSFRNAHFASMCSYDSTHRMVQFYPPLYVYSTQRIIGVDIGRLCLWHMAQLVNATHKRHRTMGQIY